MTDPVWTPRKALIVDDDPLFRVIAESFFRAQGTKQVLTAGDGLEGLKVLDGENEHPDLILVDLNMPKMDGLQFLRFLKDRDFKHPIIIASGEHRSVIELAEKLGKTHALNIVAALSKPLLPRGLEAAMQRARHHQNARPRRRTLSFSKDELQAAILADQFVPYYQPKICAHTGKVVGAEALTRWKHPDFGIVAPDSFIPMAEATGLIKPLTDHILHKVVDHARQMKEAGFGHEMAVNFSVDTMGDPTLPDKLGFLIEEHGLETSDLTLELTETQLINGNAMLIEVFARLRMLGYKLSIDDFGTAYSNLENLTHLPFTELKIDRLFVSKALTDERSMVSVDTSISLARKLGMQVVAEGVEKEEDRSYLVNRGVDVLQGFLFAKPMPFEQLMVFSAGHTPFAPPTLAVV